MQTKLRKYLLPFTSEFFYVLIPFIKKTEAWNKKKSNFARCFRWM